MSAPLYFYHFMVEYNYLSYLHLGLCPDTFVPKRNNKSKMNKPTLSQAELMQIQSQHRMAMMQDAFRELIPEIVDAVLERFRPKEKTEFYTRKEICELYHITSNTLHQWMRTGKIKYKKAGRRTLFPKNATDNVELKKYGRN